MLFSLRRLLIGALVTAALASAAVTLDSSDADAATAKCTAWGTLPDRIALASKPITVTMVLTGTSGCSGKRYDNGASATLKGPSGQQADPQRWKKFGAGVKETFQITLNKVGTYTLRNGDVQLYDSKSERVPWTWRRTSTVVRHRAKFRNITRSPSRITADLRNYTKNGWAAERDDAVVLQRRTGNAWKSIVQEKSSKSGAVAFTVSGGSKYRLVSTSTKYVWNATSPSV